jgi:hypothetical protein
LLDSANERIRPVRRQASGCCAYQKSHPAAQQANRAMFVHDDFGILISDLYTDGIGHLCDFYLTANQHQREQCGTNLGQPKKTLAHSFRPIGNARTCAVDTLQGLR